MTLNGCEEVIAKGTTIMDLLKLQGEGDDHLVVEHNDMFIPPSQYATRQVGDGDTVEFINPNLGG